MSLSVIGLKPNGKDKNGGGGGSGILLQVNETVGYLLLA